MIVPAAPHPFATHRHADTSGSSRPCSLLILDLDGTLIDSRDDLAFAVNGMLASFGLRSLPRDEIVSYVGHGIGNLVRRSHLSAGGLEFDETEALSRFRQLYEIHLLDATILYPTVRETLEEFSRIYKVILSNKSYRFIGRIIEGLGIDHLIDLYLGGDSLPVMKPDPETIHFILDQYAIPAERTLIIGDGDTDILAGKTAGIATCAAMYGFTPPEYLRSLQPDYEIGSFAEVEGILRSAG